MVASGLCGKKGRTNRSDPADLGDGVKPHWLPPLKPRVRGYDFVSCGHTGKWEEYDDSDLGTALGDARKYCLASWAIALLANETSGTTNSDCVCGTAIGDLWVSLLRLAHTRNNLVVVADNVWPLVAAIGAWQMVDEGILAMSSPRSKAEARNRAIYVTYGNPTLLTFWLAKSRDKITFADYGNWHLPKLSGRTAKQRATATLARLSSLRECVRRLGLSELELSASSIGYRLWRERHLAPKSVLVHRDARVIALERAAYYSGRCEARGTGTLQGPIYRVDIRSAYAGLAQAMQLPVKLLDYPEVSSTIADCPIREPGASIAEVVIGAKEPFAPLREGPHVVYPCGRYRTVLAGPELAEAIARGFVRGCVRVARYAMAPVLSSWAGALLDALAESRRRRDKILSGPLKLAINAGIGRIGARWRRWVPGNDGPPGWRWGQWIGATPSADRFTFWRALAGARFWQDDSAAWPDAVIAIPAWIASACRVDLARLIGIAGPRHVFYTDTDSLWCDRTGYDALRAQCQWSDTEPGALHLEGVYNRVSIAGSKVYVADGEWTLPSIDAPPGGNLLLGEPTLRQLGLADSLNRRAPPEGLGRIRRVRVRCASRRRMMGAWRWAKQIWLDGGT